MRYLSIVYSADWKAFRERLLQTDRVKQALASKVKGRKPTEDDIEEGDFLPGQCTQCLPCVCLYAAFKELA